MIIDHVSNRQFTFREMLTVGVTKSPPTVLMRRRKMKL